MDTVDTVELLPETEIVQVPVAPAPDLPIQNDIPMYKTERGFNINVLTLARDARTELDKVRTISVPAPVKRHRTGRIEFEAPTLSEVGGGTKNNFCQVIAGKDGRPVCVDDIHYINTDPTRTNINHGTASVGIGSYFSIGWCMKADLVILIYEVVSLSEYVLPTASGPAKDGEDRPKEIAKLTCQLAGYEISDWKKTYFDVPKSLMALLEVTKSRMRNDTDIPFYMDIFRMVRPVDALAQIAVDATSSEDLEHNESDYQFMEDVMSEIIDIRRCQYGSLPPATAKRKVDVLRLVETLILGENGHYIDITLTPVRTDLDQRTFRLRLTQNNFADEYGRMLIERGLTLNHISFDRLKTELEGRRDKVVVVHLTSMR